MRMSPVKSVQSQGNEIKIRLVAFFVLTLTITYFFSFSVLLPVFLIIDFALRSFDRGKFSALALISDWLIQNLKLPVKPVYMPPKRFAARIGLLFSSSILILHLTGQYSFIVCAILAFFAALESLAGICAGCYVYNFLQSFRRTN